MAVINLGALSPYPGIHIRTLPPMRAVPLLLILCLSCMTGCEIYPRNNSRDCLAQCADTDKPNACATFCACIHNNCQPLDKCLEEYDKAPTEVPNLH